MVYISSANTQTHYVQNSMGVHSPLNASLALV